MLRSLRVAMLVVAGVFYSATAWAGPGRYIVVTVNNQGQATPVFYREVELDKRGPATASQKRAAAMDPDKLVATVGAWSEVAEVPRFLRGEFAKNGVSGEIESHRVLARDRAFALRIPAKAGDKLELRFQGGRVQFSIGEIAAKSRLLPLASMKMQPAAPPPDSSNRVDILVMGDGYQSGEQALFNTHAEGLRATMFGFTPYKEYAALLNWETHFVASPQSGADHPPYEASCTASSCCADSAAQSDPRAGMFVETAFDGKFCTSQIHRLATVDYGKVLAAASARPGWDQIFVILNDPVYGGAGGGISVVSANTSADLVAVHEYGHTFTGLADEYTSPYPGYPSCNDMDGAACEANVTNQTTRSLIKWNNWLTPSIVTPTPAGTAGVGLFEGARYQTSGMYRPMDNCGMRGLGAPFCSVCSQAYVLKLYGGGFGVPATGIDLIEPGSEIPSPAASVGYALGSTVTFSATVLRPMPDTTSMQWYLDGAAVPGATGPSFNFRQVNASPGNRTLELRVTDATPLVQPAMAGNLMRHSRTWGIRVGSAVQGDYNGDRKSDLLWRNLANGVNALWLSANRDTQQPITAITGLSWKIAGSGDFNGDAKADILWRNEATGANAVWYSGNSASSQSLVGVTGMTWKIVGTGDFDGDGKSDILWRNASTGANTIWKSGNQATQQAVTQVTDANWKIVGVGDLNGDGKSDILWRHNSTGANSVWYSAISAQAQNLTTVTGMAWKIVGVGDFDGDGKADLLWRNTSNGSNTYWRSGDYANQVAMPAITDVAWITAAIGDYNGDGKADVVWRHTSSGSNAVWYSANRSLAQNLVSVTDQNWKVVPQANP